MLYTAETSASVTITATTTTTVSAGDPDLFARELGAKMNESARAAAKEGVAAAMERLAEAFPGVSITTKGGATTAEIGEFHARTGENASINIDAAMVEQMAADTTVFDRIKELVNMLFEAGQQQNMVNAGGSDNHRNVTIQEGQIRYVEVQRDARGAQLSVSALSLENEQLINDTLDQLLAARQQGGGAFTRASNFFEQFFGLGQSGASGQVSGWRLESFISNQSLQQASQSWAGGANMQWFAANQSFNAQIEIVIEQWSAAGGAGGMDFMSYMEMMGLCDPLVLDLGDEGFNLRSAEDGVYFDIKGDGSPVQTAFIQGNNAFLYLDGNGNGVADGVRELFGDYGGYANGFENLAQYDDNGDGVIDENDAVYDQLKVWRDLNGDGVNQASESMGLAEAGVKSINLNYQNRHELDEHGNVIGERSSFTRTDGTRGDVADVWLRNR